MDTTNETLTMHLARTATFHWLGGRTMLCETCATEARDEGDIVTPFTPEQHTDCQRIYGTYRCDWCDTPAR